MKRLAFKSFILLSVIYIAFIALGLPDALLGSAWNLVREDLSVGLGTLGIMTVFIYIMSIIATFNAPRLLRLFETKWITFVSILFTGIALILMSQVNEFYQMLFFALPLGIGAGAIDVSLNHYLAVNYKASHMSFLHSFYGIGVTLGPTIMAYTLKDEQWRLGYIIVGAILVFIALTVFLSMPLWHKERHVKSDHVHIPLKEIVSSRGAILSMILFLLYVHIESLLGVWISSYIYIEKGVSYSVAALFTTSYYLALTLGRLVSGILATKLKPSLLILAGEAFILLGAVLLFVKLDYWFYFVVAGLLGFGSGPIYPNLMFSNNFHFSKEKLSRIISLQMVIGYMGFGLLTPLAGLFFDRVSIAFYPVFLISASLLLVILTVKYLYEKPILIIDQK